MTSYTPQIIDILRRNGFEYWRSGKDDHQIWRHKVTGKRVTVDSKVLSRHNANKTLRDAGLPKAF
ncbi:MAG TPA: type II toxin-antitoxin system HicA family toxin [Beijerinckiaceae bacterium]|nr:type II toxin-antitoxin system HicA family toxin [Beijerinckiaceae bacterium]